jgi:hypothetical protein
MALLPDVRWLLTKGFTREDMIHVLASDLDSQRQALGKRRDIGEW